MIRRPPRSTRLTHSFPTRRSSDLVATGPERKRDMMLKNDQLEAWDRDCFFHPSTHLAQFARGEGSARIVTGGEGVYIRDRDGTRLLDAFAGLYCVNVRSDEHTSELQSLMRTSYAVFCLTKKNNTQ